MLFFYFFFIILFFFLFIIIYSHRFYMLNNIKLPFLNFLFLSEDKVVMSSGVPFFFLLIFFSSFLGLISWNFNFLLMDWEIFFLGILMVFCFFFFSCYKSYSSFHYVGYSEGFFSSLIMIMVHFLGALIKPMSLILRLTINLMFGMVILKFFSLFLIPSFKYYISGLFLFFYEFMVVVVQSLIFSYLLQSYMDFFCEFDPFCSSVV